MACLGNIKNVLTVLDMKVVTILIEIIIKLFGKYFFKNDFYSNKANTAQAILRGDGACQTSSQSKLSFLTEGIQIHLFIYNSNKIVSLSR